MMPKFTVLIVDDIPQNIQVAATTLRADGFNISFATSGREALERIPGIKPDLILLDVMMPEMDGYEVCQRLKANPETSTIPVIFLTAINEIDAAVKGFELGAVDFVNKPFNAAELLARVSAHCKLNYFQRILNEKNQILEDINASLEEHVANRTQELEDSLNKEKKFNRMTTELIGLLSHEFRTPLTIIQSGAELLNYCNTLPEEQATEQRHKISSQITQSVNTLTTHLESISNMLRSHTMLIHEQPVEMMINAYLKEVVEQFVRQQVPKQHIEVSVPGSEVVGFIMPDNMSMALNRLLDNAIHYSPEQSVIHVQMIVENNLIQVVVDDEGEGINDEDQKDMFQWFRRGKAQTQQGIYRGLGVGLALTKLCVETMGGELHYQRRSPGSRFVIDLPVPRLEVHGHYTQLVAQLGLE